MTRTLFGKPIRKETTESFYPDKISLLDFSEEIGLEAGHNFIKNMIHLGDHAIEDKYIEEWTEKFLAWSEIEQES